MFHFMSGNEAVVLACADLGIDIACGYPGTPSTEIIEGLIRQPGIQAFWNTNEKVSLETAAGASYAGARVLVAMKHVGLNVAADPLMTLSYTGVKGGLVLISCDDPNAYSSQNEQDNRNYAKFAKIPMLEPADPQEAYDFLGEAFRISEAFDTPVMMRMTTRVCHSKSRVQPGLERLPELEKVFVPDFDKYLMMPPQARARHRFVEERLERLADLNDDSGFNTFAAGEGSVLAVASGPSYLYVKEVAPDMPLFKLGMTYPLPLKSLLSAARDYDEIVVVEELDPFLEDMLLKEGLPVRRRNRAFYSGELNPDRVAAMLRANEDFDPESLPQSKRRAAPPALCSGCPHFTVLGVLRDLGVHVSGDIGCYTLGALKPYRTIHAVLDMGASIPMATGMQKAMNGDMDKPLVAVIGDSTFVHSGITGLVDAVFNKAKGTIFLLDNRSTAMTGRQGHPGTGSKPDGDDSPEIDYEALARAVGVEKVVTLDPYNFTVTKQTIEKLIDHEELTLVILRRACALMTKQTGPKVETNDKCTRCMDCTRVGCPSISFSREMGRPMIDVPSCTGCGICVEVCDDDAILPIATGPVQARKV